MNDRRKDGSCRYRVWLVACRHREPSRSSDVPPDAVALEPAEEDTFSAAEAARYVEAFNRAVLGGCRRVWAVAIPLGEVCYEGEPRAGQPLSDAGGGFSLPVSRQCPPGTDPALARARPPVPPSPSGGA